MADESTDTTQSTNQPNTRSERTYTQTELDAIVNKTRADEKGKLYADIENKNKRIAALEGAQTSSKDNSEELTNLRKQVADSEDRLRSWEKGVDEKIEKLMTEQAERYEKQREADRLGIIRQSLISSLDPDLVELVEPHVRGNTEEAIRTSFAKGKAAAEKVMEAAAKKAEEAVKKQFKGAVPAAVEPSKSDANAGGTVESTTTAPVSDENGRMKSFIRMTPAERQKLIAENKQKAFKDVGIPLKAAN